MIEKEEDLEKYTILQSAIAVRYVCPLCGWQKIGESRPAYNKGLIHYNRRRKLTAKTIRSFLGEPNHYDTLGKCVGYSRGKGLGKTIHYDRNGSEVGYTQLFLRLICFHHVLKQSDIWFLLSGRTRSPRSFEHT